MGDRVTKAAVRYVGICAAERDLRKRRGACECEHQQPAHMMGQPKPADRHPDGGSWSDLECWKMINNHDGGLPSLERYGEGSDRGWCDSCTERQRLHEELAGVVRMRVGAWATLRAAVAAEVCDG